MNRFVRLTALTLALVMLCACFAGCKNDPAPTDPPAVTTTPPTTEPIETTVPPTTEPEPTWPVIEEVVLPEFALEYHLTDDDIARAEEMIAICEELSYSEAPREIIEDAWEKLDLFLDYIITEVSIAQVLYYQNLKDETLSSAYLDTYDKFLDLADKTNMLQKRMYDDSPVKDWFFEDWPEEDIEYLKSYTSEIVELQAKLNQIEVDFLDLSETEMYNGFVPLYIDYVTIGNQIAKLCGYDNFYAYKSDLTYNRDYTTEDIALFQSYVKTKVMPNFDSYINPALEAMNALSDDEYMTVAYFMNMDYDQLPVNYLQGYIDSYEGSTSEWLHHMFDNSYYITSDSQNSYPGAFCTSFDCYDVNFCYFGPGYQGTMTVVHEMGHYYANHFAGDYDAFDLLESHSQCNEALLTAYLKDQMTPNEYKFVKYYNLYDHVVMIAVCTMVDAFEQRIYAMESIEGFTSADFDKIIDEICDEYFADLGGAAYVSTNVADMKSYIRQVAINSPCYYISYATSLVTTMNMLVQAEEDPAAAREVYRKLCEETADMTYSEALAHAGAADPFKEESFNVIEALFG